MHTHICTCMYACAYICIDGFLSSDVNTWEEGRRTISLHRPDSDSVLPDLYTLRQFSFLRWRLPGVSIGRGIVITICIICLIFGPVILLYTYISIILDWSHDIPPKSSLRGELFDSGFFFFHFGQSKKWRKSRNSIFSLFSILFQSQDLCQGSI